MVWLPLLPPTVVPAPPVMLQDAATMSPVKLMVPSAAMAELARRPATAAAKMLLI
ncbi:hypothetical protein D3C80_499580 [compost metagenome]